MSQIGFLNTGYIIKLWTCAKYVRKQSVPKQFQDGLHYSFGHVWSMYRSSPFRSKLNTGYITTLDMCEVCTEAVHYVANWTQVSLQLWTCRKTLKNNYITALDMCEVCTEAVHSVTIWTQVTSQLWTCVKYAEAVHSVAIWTQVTLQLWTCVKYAEAVHSVAIWTPVTVQLWTCVKYVPKQFIP